VAVVFRANEAAPAAKTFIQQSAVVIFRLGDWTDRRDENEPCQAVWET
jgi:hypothetical protein